MKFLLFFLIILLFSFQGCSIQQPDTSKQLQEKTISQYTVVVPEKKDKPILVESTGFESEFEETDVIQSDPLSGYNTFMTSFNDKVITYALNPVSKAYAFILPQAIRIALSNAIDNIEFPVRFANNILQGKFSNSTDELGRFVINSTIGFAGLADVASELNIPAHNEDFGQTLGFYGVDSGFHIVLPFLGPSNVRDVIGLSVDAYTSPLVHVSDLENYKVPENFAQSTAIRAGYIVNTTSLELGHYESFKKDALELYPFLRNIYEQKRTSQIEE